MLSSLKDLPFLSGSRAASGHILICKCLVSTTSQSLRLIPASINSDQPHPSFLPSMSMSVPSALRRTHPRYYYLAGSAKVIDYLSLFLSPLFKLMSYSPPFVLPISHMTMDATPRLLPIQKASRHTSFHISMFIYLNLLIISST